MTDSLQALENRLESATGLERSELLISLSLGYNNLSPAKAQSYAEEALTLAIQERSRSLEAESLNALGRASLGQLAYSEALEQLQKSLSIYEDIDSQEGIAEVLGTIGLVYHSDGERKKALEYLNRSLETAEKSEALNLILESCRSLSELYEKDRNFKKALEYHRRMSELEEKLFSEEKSRIIARIDAVFQTEKAEQEAEINRLRNIELNEKKQLIEAQAESLQRANVKISVHREELIMKNMELEKLLKEKDEFLSRMVKHISDGVMIDDQKGKILYVNDRFLEIFSL
ncbi:MAG: tetratricopeptide repeat protein, partial [Candidatus Fermentibacteria bacterium]